MENLIKTGRIFFSIGLIAFCIHQLFYGDLRPVLLATWPSWIPGIAFWSCLGNLLIILACAMVILEKNALVMAILLGFFLLLSVIMNHIPYQLSTNLHFIAGWSDALKALAFSGGAFAIAGTLTETRTGAQSKLESWIHPMTKLIPFARIFFSIPILIFGFEHFLYPDFVATLVPNWIPWHLFWTYFAGIALLASGFSILLNLKASLACILLGTMIFLWFIMLHLPRAFADPYSGNGNEWRSVFESFSFSGIAFILAGFLSKKGQTIP